jgi:hypothetical protein
MKYKVRNILNKGTAENCSRNEEIEMYSIFHHPDKEFEVKENLFEDLSSDTLSIEFDPSQFKTLFYTYLEKN